MPRRRPHYRRLEWSRSMESMITLVDGSQAITPDTTNVSAEARPGQLRNSVVIVGTPLDAVRAERMAQVAADGAPAVSESAPVVRYHSEQTTVSVTPGEDSGAKTLMGFGQRVRESLKRRLRSIGNAIMLTHLHESAQGIDGYYAVSMA
ncbi:hypothetical protein GGI10_000231 [Coemansia sp. RSA 2530]|nr:hypothetical protein GGI06_000272 [Coemansia sp. S85]KAJ2417371.1 hypothetical protein GGI10_000231 [Coemansia sp. RSA 2530]